MLRLASSYRALLPGRYLRKSDAEQHPVQVTSPDLERIIRADPSECVDSANIMPALRQVFPEATVICLGGVVYYLALNDILANFDEQDETDLALLELLLNADDLLADAGYNLRAAAFATKERRRFRLW